MIQTNKKSIIKYQIKYLIIIYIFMCWNSKVSLNTFLFTLFGISLAYFNNIINFFDFLHFFAFSSLQLVEYFAWENLNDKKMNKFLSQIGLFLIFIQVPLFIIYPDNVETNLKKLLIAIYLIFFLFIYFYYPIQFSMHKAANGHLAWDWLNFPTYIIFIWLSFILGLIFYKKEYLNFCIYFIIIFSIYYTYYKTNTWGSLWCWISNLLASKLIIMVFISSDPSNCLSFKCLYKMLFNKNK